MGVTVTTSTMASSVCMVLFGGFGLWDTTRNEGRLAGMIVPKGNWSSAMPWLGDELAEGSSSSSQAAPSEVAAAASVAAWAGEMKVPETAAEAASLVEELLKSWLAMLMEDPLKYGKYIAGAIGIDLALVALVLWRRRRSAKKGADAPAADTDTEAEGGPKPAAAKPAAAAETEAASAAGAASEPKEKEAAAGDQSQPVAQTGGA